MSPRKRLTFSVLAIALGLLALEGAARLVVPPRESPTHKEHEELIRVLGLPALNDTMEFDPQLFWRLKPELRGFRVTGRIREQPFDFTVTTHASLRSPPIPPSKTRPRILALGDSCTFGLGVNDHETWPAQLQRMLEQKGIEADVINAGVPGYTAFQGLRFLETRGLALSPDVVVVSFGFNDRDEGMSQSDFETARALAVARWERYLVKSRLYDGLRRIVSSVGKKDAGQPGARSKPRARLSEMEFYDVLGRIKRACDARGIRLFFMNWPWEQQVRERLGLYYYQNTAAGFCSREGVPIIDLLEAFTRAGGPLFLDHVHANREGCRVAAEATLDGILPTLVPSKSSIGRVR